MRALLALAMLLVAPTAVAGSPEDPEVIDAPLDATGAVPNAWADIVAAWVEETPERGLAFTVQFSHMAAPQLGVGYGMHFDLGSGGRFVALVQQDVTVYWTGDWDHDTGRPMGDTRDVEGSFTTGPRGTVTIVLPPSEVAHNVTTVTGMGAMVLDFKALLAGGDEGFVTLDEASAVRDLMLSPPPPAPSPPPNATAPEGAPQGPEPGGPAKAASPATSPSKTPWGGVPLVAGAIAGAALLTRRGRR